MARINCPNCSQQLELPDGAAGKTIRCPKCQQTFAFPVETRAAPIMNIEEAITEETPQPKLETPQRKRTRRAEAAPAKSSALLPILLVGGGLALGLCFCGAVGISASIFSFRAVKQAAAQKVEAARAKEHNAENVQQAEMDERRRVAELEAEKARFDKKQAEDAKPQHGEYKRLNVPNNGGEVRALVFSGDGNSISAATRSETVHSWDLGTGKVATHALGNQPGGAEIGAVAFSPAADKVLFGRHGGRLCCYDLHKELAPQTSINIGNPGRQFAFNSIAVSPDGQRACTGHGDSVAFVWELATLKQVSALKDFQNQVYSCAFHPHNDTVAAGAQDVQVLNPKTGAVLHFKGGGPSCFRSLAFSRDGRFLAGLNGNSLYRWNLDDPKAEPIKLNHDQSALHLAYSPDGKTLAVALHHTRLVLYDAATLKQRFLIDLRKDRNNWDTPGAIAYHSDSQHIAISRGSTIYLFDLKGLDK